ncbi:hypothetical protein GCM10027073_20020 [Streptomyces chlorus]
MPKTLTPPQNPRNLFTMQSLNNHRATTTGPPSGHCRTVTRPPSDHRRRPPDTCSIPDEFRPWGCSALDAHNGLRQIEARHPTLRGAKSAMQTIRTRTTLRVSRHRTVKAARPEQLGRNQPTAPEAWLHPYATAAC